METGTNRSTLNDRPRKLLLLWMKNAKRVQIAHYDSANIFSKYHRRLGVPIVVITTLIGTGIVSTLQEPVHVGLQITVGLLSMAAAILAALQTLLSYEQRAVDHRKAANRFEGLKRKIQESLALVEDVKDVEELKRRMRKIRKVFDRIASSSPVVPPRIWRRALVKIPRSRPIL